MFRKKLLLSLCAVLGFSFCLNTVAFASEKGYASYYANKFQGHKTASGQRYDRKKLTAAHKYLAFGSKVEVTNTKNQRSVVVTINDRGPFIKKRVIDLSYVAAKKLGLINSGVVPVQIKVLPKEDPINNLF